jgi:hypothetical protein
MANSFGLPSDSALQTPPSAVSLRWNLGSASRLTRSELWLVCSQSTIFRAAASTERSLSRSSRFMTHVEPVNYRNASGVSASVHSYAWTAANRQCDVTDHCTFAAGSGDNQTNNSITVTNDGTIG